jgi:flagellar biosynthesis protein FliR
MLRDLLTREAVLFSLLFSRVGGFVLTSPFPGERVPKSSRLAFALFIAFFCRTIDDGPKSGLGFDIALAPAVVNELALGIVIGFVFRIFTSAAEIAGDVISQAVGLGSASVMNPLFGANETVVSRLLSLAGLLLVLTSGAHRVVLGYLIESFSAQSVAVGVRLGMPAIAMSVIVQLGLAMVARVAPSLQVFNIGFAVLIGAGLLTLASALPDIGLRFLEHTARAPDALDRIFSEMAAP